MKKTFMIPPFLALAALLSIASCDNVPKEAPAQEKAMPRIDMFLYDQDVYISSVAASVKATLTGKAILEVHSAKNEQLIQNEQIDAVLAKKPDALIINLVDMQASGLIADKAKKAGIPVVFFNREPDLKTMAAAYDRTCFVGTIPMEAGKMQGDIIRHLWGKHPDYDRNKDGKFQYIMIQANAYNPEALARSEYSVRRARELGMDMVQIGDTLLCDWSETQALEAMRLALAVFAEQLELVIANNDSMALGAIAALAELGYNTGEPGGKFIPVVGVDATEQGLEAIRKGTMSGTVKQDGKLMGEIVAALALNVATGKGFLDGTNLQWDDSGRAVRLPYFPMEAEQGKGL